MWWISCPGYAPSAKMRGASGFKIEHQDICVLQLLHKQAHCSLLVTSNHFVVCLTLQTRRSTKFKSEPGTSPQPSTYQKRTVCGSFRNCGLGKFRKRPTFRKFGYLQMRPASPFPATFQSRMTITRSAVQPDDGRSGAVQTSDTQANFYLGPRARKEAARARSSSLRLSSAGVVL